MKGLCPFQAWNIHSCLLSVKKCDSESKLQLTDEKGTALLGKSMYKMFPIVRTPR